MTGERTSKSTEALATILWEDWYFGQMSRAEQAADDLTKKLADRGYRIVPAPPPPTAAPARVSTQQRIPGTNLPAVDEAPASPEAVGPVRSCSSNCIAGDHDECARMVEQDDPELGITDCLCDCHAAEAIAAASPSGSSEPRSRRNPTFQTFQTECDACGTLLTIRNNYSPQGDFLDQSIESRGAPGLDVEKIVRLAKDWHVSDEFIGKVVRAQVPREYAAEADREEKE